MKIVQIKIAGREYDVCPLPIKANREWRLQFQEPLQDAANLVAELGDFAGEEFDKPADLLNKILSGLSGNLSSVVKHLLGSADMITQAVFQYSPAINEDKEYIEEHGYDEELVAAFMQLLSLAFPFGSAIRGLMDLGKEEPKANGQEDQETDQNSALESSESETTN